MITSVNNFPFIRSLQTLSVSNNEICDLSSFINAVKAKYPQVKSLNTLKNPMNPGMGQPSAYNQYKSYMKTISNNLTELDGMNMNDNSFMNQQQQPKRDLFGTSTSSQPKRDLFGTSSSSTKVSFFDTPATNNMNNNMNSNMNTNLNSAFNSQNTNTQQPTKTKMGLFDNMPKSSSQSSKSTTMFADTRATNSSSNTAMATNTSNGGDYTSGLVFKRQFFVIDESTEIDGTEFVKSKKKKSIVMVNEKMLKKSDNMTKFNRKNRSEGNKHILNSEL